MQIFIKKLTGDSITLEVESWTTIKDLKTMIHVKEGISIDQQRIVFAGNNLCDTKTLKDYDIAMHSCLHIILKLTNTPKKKEKTKPCPLCFCDKTEDKFVYFPECKHASCKECSRDRLSVYITNEDDYMLKFHPKKKIISVGCFHPNCGCYVEDFHWFNFLKEGEMNYYNELKDLAVKWNQEENVKYFNLI